jgi:leucyl-tRNA synthetase
MYAEKDGVDTFAVTDAPLADDDKKILHQTMKKVTEDIEGLRFNTAISQMMVFVNHFTGKNTAPKDAMVPFVQLLHPYAPHLAEEFWAALGRKDSLSYAAWPVFDPKLVAEENMTIAIQVLGKLRGTIEVQVDASQADIESLAMALPGVVNFMEGKTVQKVIYVPKKLVNFVVR